MRVGTGNRVDLLPRGHDGGQLRQVLGRMQLLGQVGGPVRVVLKAVVLQGILEPGTET